MKQVTRSIIFLVVLVLSNAMLKAAVFIDTGFGTNGTSVVSQGTQAYVIKITTQADGKIIALGICNLAGASTIFVARFTTAGLFDTTFNVTGLVTLNYGSNLWATSMVVQSDGKILIGGGTVVDGSARAFLARYTSAGALDETFGSGGIITQLIGTSSGVNALAIQSISGTDYILFVGQAIVNGVAQIVVSRHMLDGTIDAMFGSEGLVMIQIGSIATPVAITLQSDNKIVVAGSAFVGNRKFALVRYTSSGALDTDFGNQGVVTTAVTDSIDDGANDVIIQNDGKIVIVGRSQINGRGVVSLACYLSAGALDGDFGTAGITTTLVGSAAEGASIHRKADGSFVITASVDDMGMIAKYSTNGILDTTFGSNGFVSTVLSNAQSLPPACVDSLERILIGGAIGEEGSVACYHTNSTDFVAIDSPAASSTQIGTFTLQGRASRANMSVRIKADMTVIATTTTDANGNWSAGASPLLANGSRSIIADLMDGETVVATATNGITMNATDSIVITAPASGTTVETYTPIIKGTSTRASSSLRVKIDGAVVATVITDSLGGWQTTSSRIKNGSHTILAELMDDEAVVASAMRTFTVGVISWPGQTDCSNLRIVSGSFTATTPPNIISGSGVMCPPTCTFSVARIRPNRYRIDFIPAFFYTPTVTATVEKSGDANVSVAVQSSATLSSVTIDVDSKTDEVYFLAMSCRG